MKTSTTVLIAGITLALAGPSFAGRDQSQIVQQERAIKAVQAQRLAQAQKAQQGLAGATGVPGKAGPSGQPTQVNKMRPPRL